MKDIKKILPQRYPFLFLDRVTETEKLNWAKGYKNVALNDWYINPNEDDPTMPQVLILEALAQLGAFVLKDKEENLGLLASVQGVKFLDFAYPGDCINLHFEVIKKKTKSLRGKGIASVNGKEIMVADKITIIYLQ